MFWNFCSSCRVFLKALFAKLLDREEDVSSCRVSGNLRLQNQPIVWSRSCAKEDGKVCSVSLNSGRFSKAGFWKAHLWLLILAGFFLFCCVHYVVPIYSLEQVVTVSGYWTQERFAIENSFGGLFFLMPPISLTSLYMCENQVTSEYHAVIPACNMVAPFLVQPTTLSEFINCTSGFIEIISECDVSVGPSSWQCSTVLGILRGRFKYVAPLSTELLITFQLAMYTRKSTLESTASLFL